MRKKLIFYMVSLFAIVFFIITGYISYEYLSCKDVPNDMRDYVYLDYGDEGSSIGRCELWKFYKNDYKFLEKMGMKNSPEGKAYSKIKFEQEFFSKNKFDFRLEKVFEDEKFAKFRVIPANNSIDEAQIYLMKGNFGEWYVVAGPSTAFPDLNLAYPELKGR